MKKLFALMSVCAILFAGTTAFAQVKQAPQKNEKQEMSKPCSGMCNPEDLAKHKTEYLKKHLKMPENQLDAF